MTMFNGDQMREKLEEHLRRTQTQNQQYPTPAQTIQVEVVKPNDGQQQNA